MSHNEQVEQLKSNYLCTTVPGKKTEVVNVFRINVFHSALSIHKSP